jgi:tRNA G18 (ribose-2'-O)-methylase SpoU
MRGYFGFGVERISKPINLGTLMRSAHAFDASFFFTVGAAFSARQARLSDTSDAAKHLPLYVWEDIAAMQLPRGCQLVGVELTEEAIDLPSFRHPQAAAYVLGPERGSLSPEMQARCDLIVKIPTKFCVNVGIAGALVMYDRTLSMGRFAPRPARPGEPPAPMPEHVHGGPVFRTKREG